MFSIMDGTRSPIQSVLDIFATDLADVRFADVDAPTLVRLAGDVELATDAVASAQAARDLAQAELKERQKVLLDYVQRAVAYARVYAENDEALSARLDAIALPRPARRKSSDDTLVLSPEPTPPPNRRRIKAQSEPLLPPIASAALAGD